MDTRTLRWFQLVADGVTLTEISELELISQPAITRALHRLDSELGARLLRRSGRTLTLTPAGAVFRRHVDAVLHHLDDGIAAVAQLLDPETGTVVIAFEPSLGSWLVPDLVRSFRLEHPDVVVDLRTTTDECSPSTWPDSDVDLEVSTLHPPPSSHGWQRLSTERLVVAVGRDDPLAGDAAITLGDLGDQPFVATRPGTLLRSQFDDLCGRAGFDPMIALVADDVGTLRGYAAAGLGIAVVPAAPASSVAAEAAVHELALLDAGAEREIGMSWSRERRPLPAAILFRDHVAARVRTGALEPTRPGGPLRS